jgi:mannose-6-phosphate isomerase-like protein (cupin superfamily)
VIPAAPTGMPEIFRGSQAAELRTEERCYITELANDATDPDVSIALARVEPGVTTAWHALRGITERYVVLEGIGRVEVGELGPKEVGPGDVVYIPPGTRQRIANVGTVDLRFYAICSPRFMAECYQGLE